MGNLTMWKMNNDFETINYQQLLLALKVAISCGYDIIKQKNMSIIL